MTIGFEPRSEVTLLTANADLPVRARLLLITPLVFLALVASVHAQSLFTPPLSFDTGQLPYSVAIADLNADGRPDMVAANRGSNTVSVLLGNGDGTFGPRTDFVTGVGPSSVAIADLNADGRPDLVTNGFETLYGSSDLVWVLLGNGDGTFGPPRSRSVAASSVAIADLNADGRPDLVAANAISNTVSVLLGNGDGTFGPNTEFPAGSNPLAAAIADLNADGRPDLVIADYGCPATACHVVPDGSSVSVLLGNGDGTFGPKTDYFTGLQPYRVAIADLNADGRPDLAVVNYFSNTVSVLLGNGDGTFGPRADFGTGSYPISEAIADLNGDRRPDLAVANYASNTVSVLLGNGDCPATSRFPQ